MGIKTPSITNSRQSMPRNFPMNIDSLGMGEVSNPSNVLNSRSSRNNLFIPRVPEKINATQMIPGPTVAISCGDGSNVKLKINAITTENGRIVPIFSRVRNSRIRSLRKIAHAELMKYCINY
tara:strand:- start:299 stop:664 length:366 start_codon:yes stop_codon:yes gene_type:complete